MIKFCLSSTIVLLFVASAPTASAQTALSPHARVGAVWLESTLSDGQVVGSLSGGLEIPRQGGTIRRVLGLYLPEHQSTPGYLGVSFEAVTPIVHRQPFAAGVRLSLGFGHITAERIAADREECQTRPSCDMRDSPYNSGAAGSLGAAVELAYQTAGPLRFTVEVGVSELVIGDSSGGTMPSIAVGATWRRQSSEPGQEE